jgi:uncharacterized repeat protein (TIGR01451 family)
MVNHVTASAAGCPAVRASASTEVEGVSALLLEVVDTKDPVLIGDTTVYKVSVRNTGSAPGRNIKIKAFFEKELEFVSSTGTSRPLKTGPVTEFAPVDLGIGKIGVWNITARGVAAADVRFKVVVDADGFERPVQETEATTVY